MTFHVIDKRTGKEPIFDYNHIFKEKWFKESGLIACDIDGWYIGEDGELILVDDCGRAVYPPTGRFEIVFEEARKKGKWITIHEDEEDEPAAGFFRCSCCKDELYDITKYCPSCGSYNGG